MPLLSPPRWGHHRLSSCDSICRSLGLRSCPTSSQTLLIAASRLILPRHESDHIALLLTSPQWLVTVLWMAPRCQSMTPEAPGAGCVLLQPPAPSHSVLQLHGTVFSRAPGPLYMPPLPPEELFLLTVSGQLLLMLQVLAESVCSGPFFLPYMLLAPGTPSQHSRMTLSLLAQYLFSLFGS